MKREWAIIHERSFDEITLEYWISLIMIWMQMDKPNRSLGSVRDPRDDTGLYWFFHSLKTL
jgi:hypothetical protein